MKKRFPIIDLHCDLLSYLEKAPGSTHNDVEAVGCAVPHLKAGGVKLQVMALFAPTAPGSVEKGMGQAVIWRQLLEDGVFRRWETGFGMDQLTAEDDAIYVLPAIENASNFAREDEPLDRSLARMEQLLTLIGQPFYISLTHHPENRFGGGDASLVGLKPDGKVLLEVLSGRGIVIDLSHTSDPLAHDILNHIEARGLDLRIMASHSNFRPVTNHLRNLPDELARELIRRQSLIGLNFVRDFIGPDDPDKLFAHVRYALELGAGDNLAWGADFFPAILMPKEYDYRIPFFHPEHENSSVYPVLLERMGTEAPGMDLEKLCWGNVLRFLTA